MNSYSYNMCKYSGIGNIVSPDEETSNLIKYLKDNIIKIQSICQRVTNEGNSNK